MTSPRSCCQLMLALLSAFANTVPTAPIFSSKAAAAETKYVSRESSPAVVSPVYRSPLRATISLDGEWDFAIDPQASGETEGWYLPERNLPSPRKIQVPGCWEAQGAGEPGLSHPRAASQRTVFEPVVRTMRSTYTGRAWYRKEVAIPANWQGKQIWLKIGGVNSQGWFWINGKFVAHDYNYCAVNKYEITDLVKPGEKVVLTALVRNDVPSRRGCSNIIRTYGGLFRSVELEATADVSLENVYAETLFDEQKVKLQIAIHGGTNKFTADQTDRYELALRVFTCAGEKLAAEIAKEITLSGEATTLISLALPLNPFTPWSPENPFLYKAEVVLKKNGTPIDGWIERFGVKKFEVKNTDLYLNNQRYFLRGFGDDHVYPITVCSPASRETHLAHLKMAKAYGFNYVRHHTHCEVPEFYQAAEEAGIMVQPELPYWADPVINSSRHMSFGAADPLQDLKDLVTHYRRFTALATYCGGNEGCYSKTQGEELYRLAKQLDNNRPFLSQDGGENWKGGSDLDTISGHQTHVPLQSNDWACWKHEFMSLGLNEDVRLDRNYTGGYLPNMTLAEAKKIVIEQIGLDWKWADGCFDAGYRLQGIYHKLGFEAVRLDPLVDGYINWLMVDISPNSQNGVLDMFWEQKTSTPEYFSHFNGPLAILARTIAPQPNKSLSAIPEAPVYSAGENLEIDWVISNYLGSPVENAKLKWRLVAGEKVYSPGEIVVASVATGGQQMVGRGKIVMPDLEKPQKVQLVAELEGRNISNFWNLWIFPKFLSPANAGSAFAVSANLYDVLHKRYLGLRKAGTPEAKKAKLVVTKSFLDPETFAALDEGKSVICLSLPGHHLISPGVRLGWWGTTNQTGTVVAKHPAFGDFPHEGFMDQQFFRLIDRAENLSPGHPFRQVEMLMVGSGWEHFIFGDGTGDDLRYNLLAFQARAVKGKLLATGLNLLSDLPEATYLLDQFIHYAQSDQFQPQGTFKLSDLRKKMKDSQEITKNLNGWSTTLKFSESQDYPSPVGQRKMLIVRQTDGKSEVVWQTPPVEKSSNGSIVLQWLASTGWKNEPAGGHFTLYIKNRPLLDFDIAEQSHGWKSSEDAVQLHYEVLGHPRDEPQDTYGVMKLTLPASFVTSGEPLELRVVGSASGSRRFFGLYEP